MNVLFVLFLFYQPVFSAVGCFELDSIAQQQGTEAME
jgi:hypothetical protein